MMEDSNNNNNNGPSPSFIDDEEEGIAGNLHNSDGDGGRRTSYWKKHKRIVLVGVGLVVAVVVAVVLGVTLSNNNNNNKNGSNVDGSNGSNENEQLANDGMGQENSKGEAEEFSTTGPTFSMNNPEALVPAMDNELQIMDDNVSFVAGTDETYYISVLDNDHSNSQSNAADDSKEEAVDLLNVQSIVQEASSGSCAISIDLQQVIYIPNEEDFVGRDECIYEACKSIPSEEGKGVGGEGGDNEKECGTAIITITMKENVEDIAPDNFDHLISPILHPTQQLLIDSNNKYPDLIIRDAVVAIHGNTAIVGAANADGYNGTVLVYERDATTNEWTHQAKLNPPDGSVFTYFGWSLDIFENTIIVGAWGDSDEDNGIYNIGCAHIFVRESDTNNDWRYQAKLVAPDGERQADDHFGYDVAIYQDTAVVGVWQDDVEDKMNSGSVHIFFRNINNDNDWTHEAKLVAPDGTSKDAFGNSVGIYEDTVVVGAWYDDYEHQGLKNGTDSGSAHIFVRTYNDDANGDNSIVMAEWTHQAKLMDIVGEAQDWFGNRVAIHGDTVVVGARGDDSDDMTDGVDSGSVYIFTRSEKEEKWTRQAKLVAPDGAAGDQFGNSIDIYDDILIVGSRWDDDSGTDSGSAHVFVRDTTAGEGGVTPSSWVHKAKLLGPDGGGEKEDFFGFSVGIYDGTVVVGSKSGEISLFTEDL